RGFESRHPLGGMAHTSDAGSDVIHGGLAERRGSGLQSRIHGFESRTHLAWAIGAAVARFPDTEEVTGSNPVSPTTPSGTAGTSCPPGLPGARGRRTPIIGSRPGLDGGRSIRRFRRCFLFEEFPVPNHG